MGPEMGYEVESERVSDMSDGLSSFGQAVDDQGEVVFDEPWQARAFALAVALNEQGHMDWPEWAERFSRRIAEYERTGNIKGSGDYYRLWLETLEEFAQQ